MAGLEPATPCSQSRCATKLRHIPDGKSVLGGRPWVIRPHAFKNQGAFADLVAMTATYPTKRPRSHLLNFAAIVLGLLASGAMVLTASQAAFSDTTSNSSNSFSTGNVELVDDDSGSAAFNVTNMAPGDTVEQCIEVTYQGSIADPSAVKLYSGGLTDSGTLAAHLDLTIEEGTGGSFGSCAAIHARGQQSSGTRWTSSLLITPITRMALAPGTLLPRPSRKPIA